MAGGASVFFMLSTHELRTMVQSLEAEAFKQQLGPFALIQRPIAGTNALGSDVPATAYVKREAISDHSLALIFEFENLLIASLPPLGHDETLTVGRLPGCDLMIDDPSVSKQHAVLRWNQAEERCSVEDLGSTNGTFLNASTLIRGETVLKDGDVVSFGDVQFWYLKSDTLHKKLTSRSSGSTLTG
jgi:FHA domain-containing protein